MKIRIKQFRGVPVVNGFFPLAGVRMKPEDVFECDDELAEKCLETDMVEIAMSEPTMSQDASDAFECPQCEKSFKTEKGLDLHIAKSHKVSNEAS
jgi:hypothetical protein